MVTNHEHHEDWLFVAPSYQQPKFLESVNFWSERQINLGLAVWAKNLFTPMYGQQDFMGKFISFFIRLIQIIVRSIFMLFWLIVGLVWLVFWIALPPLTIGGIIYQLL